VLALVCIVVGLIFVVIHSIWLWYITARPKPWEKFTEAENAFWVRRGLPVKWADACKEFECGRGLKILVAACVIGAVALTIAPFVLPLIFLHHHG
jgi:uncharacterized membrane protein YvlD (DUF360 family)